MKNWAGTIEFQEEKTWEPTSTQEVQQMVQAALSQKKCIRPAGSGHSWTHLMTTSDWICSLTRLSGFIEENKNKNSLRFLAGTKLHDFTRSAFSKGYNLANQGDVDPQTIAGLSSTGTHGTGLSLPSSPNLIESITLVDGSGHIHHIKKEEELSRAAFLAIGSLGIITEIEWKLEPAYKLKVHTCYEKDHLTLAKLLPRLKQHRHLEFFYFPVGDWQLVKTMDITDDEVTSSSKFDQLKTKWLENHIYEGLNKLAVTFKSYRLLDKVMQKFITPHTFIQWAHLAFPSPRDIKFHEMEYNLDLNMFEDVWSEIRECIRKNNFETLFPIEIRFVKGDDIWLSPAYGRDSVYFAIHAYKTENYLPYFQAIESIFKKYHGRPHWGKWHTSTRSDLEKVYPKWSHFCEIRKSFDPQNIFINPYLKKLFF